MSLFLLVLILILFVGEAAPMRAGDAIRAGVSTGPDLLAPSNAAGKEYRHPQVWSLAWLLGASGPDVLHAESSPIFVRSDCLIT